MMVDIYVFSIFTRWKQIELQYMELLTFAIILVLLILLIYLLVKHRKLKEELHQAIVERGELLQSDLVLHRLGAYFLLVNENNVVCDTNYYSLNGLPEPEKGVVKKVGDMLRCRNAVEAGECGSHENCKLCCINASLWKAFRDKSDIKKLSASMNLLSRDEMKVIPCDVSVSGTYLNLRGDDYMLLTVYDVTELRNMQRLLDIERENSLSIERLRSAFIANMSHEVRTPLNSIVGFSGLIVTAATEEERKLYADIIVENNERLLHLVNDIFDLSQIEAGILKFEYSDFDANDLLREAEGIYSLKLTENTDVRLVCEARVEPFRMHSDRQRILQVLASLLHNAMKFTKSGEIRFGCSQEDEEHVRFSVSDTGIGIPEEEQKKIFSHFSKLDREVPGTGLGLTLAQAIVQNLGGTVGVRSEVNKGSTFWFILPLTAKPKIAE